MWWFRGKYFVVVSLDRLCGGGGSVVAAVWQEMGPLAGSSAQSISSVSQVTAETPDGHRTDLEDGGNSRREGRSSSNNYNKNYNLSERLFPLCRTVGSDRASRM
jgi:hypothetical protein